MEDEFAHGIRCLMNNAFEDATKVFGELLQRDVHNPFILHNFGLANECLGNIDEAIEIYERNVDMHPTHVLSYLCLSNANLYKDKLHKSICWLKKAQETCGTVPVQLHILMSEACFLAGNPSEGLVRHATALDMIDKQNLTLTSHHVQLYTDYGDGSMPHYAWIENSYISHGKPPTLEFVASHSTTHADSNPSKRTLVLVLPQDADRVRKQLEGMTEQERGQLFVVAQSSIVERLLGGTRNVDARVVHSVPYQNDMELYAYVLDVSHEVLHATGTKTTRVLCPGESNLLSGRTLEVDDSVRATRLCPMLLRGEPKSAQRIYALSSLQ
jgi:tetratricopeptide (TPR) repeat protein